MLIYILFGRKLIIFDCMLACLLFQIETSRILSTYDLTASSADVTG